MQITHVSSSLSCHPLLHQEPWIRTWNLALTSLSLYPPCRKYLPFPLISEEKKKLHEHCHQQSRMYIKISVEYYTNHLISPLTRSELRPGLDPDATRGLWSVTDTEDTVAWRRDSVLGGRWGNKDSSTGSLVQECQSYPEGPSPHHQRQGSHPRVYFTVIATVLLLLLRHILLWPPRLVLCYCMFTSIINSLL